MTGTPRGHFLIRSVLKRFKGTYKQGLWPHMGLEIRKAAILSLSITFGYKDKVTRTKFKKRKWPFFFFIPELSPLKYK